jgi:hypothetical protein
VTESGEFEAQLAAQAWERVIISARYAGGEPSYASALRAFATAHPESMVHLFLWHESGTQSTADTAVMGTTAHFLWNRGMTTKSYRDAAPNSTAPEARQAQTVRGGLLFPDFGGIAVEEAEVLFRVPQAQAQGLSAEELTDAVFLALAAGDDCTARCRNEWANRVAGCEQDHQGDAAACDALYGPGAAPENQDPEKYTQCMTEANTDYTNCLNSAAHRYELCILLCGLSAVEPK